MDDEVAIHDSQSVQEPLDCVAWIDKRANGGDSQDFPQRDWGDNLQFGVLNDEAEVAHPRIDEDTLGTHVDEANPKSNAAVFGGRCPDLGEPQLESAHGRAELRFRSFQSSTDEQEEGEEAWRRPSNDPIRPLGSECALLVSVPTHTTYPRRYDTRGAGVDGIRRSPLQQRTMAY